MSGADQTFAPGNPLLVEQARRSSATLTYGRLRQRNPQYDDKLMQELHDLHAGGYTVQSRAKSYLFPLCNEHEKRYDERCSATSFVGYFGQIVEQFASDLFAQPLSIMAAADSDNPNTPGESPDDDFYSQFESDVDLRGTKFVDMMRDVMTTAMVQRCAFVCIDAPEKKGPLPQTRAEEDADETRIYAYEMSPRHVVDWREDDRGGFVWLIINKQEQDRITPLDVRDAVRETFTVWTMSDQGFAEWARYAITYPANKKPEEQDLVPLEDEGTTTFRRIPVIRLRLPKGLWVGNKVGPPQKEHWQRRSALIGAQNRSMMAIPYVKRGPEIGAPGGAMPSATQEVEDRGRDPARAFNREGFVELGADDALDYAEPKGHCYELVAKQLDELKDEIFRVAHQMAASVRPSAGSLGRSAASKQQDGKATALVLRALGQEARQMALTIYRTISDALAQKDVIWTANGLDNYEVIDRESVLEEAISLEQVPIPSETFKITYFTQVAEKLVTGVDPQTLDQIRKEIKEGVKSMHELSEIKLDAAKDEILNPEPPMVPQAPGVKSPVPKQPTAKTPAPPGSKSKKAA